MRLLAGVVRRGRRPERRGRIVGAALAAAGRRSGEAETTARHDLPASSMLTAAQLRDSEERSVPHDEEFSGSVFS
jgi:hypothetical protein